MITPPITITRTDSARLHALLNSVESRDRGVVDALENELDRAHVVAPEEVPPTVVTMNSKVVVESETGERQEVTLVYPREADAASGRISVLAPLGAALLGLSAGQTIEWAFPGGRTKRVRVVEVSWQPEAHGLFTL